MDKPYSNFIVSNSEIFWQKNTNECFISNPLLAFAFKKKFNSYFKKIKVGKHRRNLKKDANYVDLKYKMYLKIMSVRLNKIHNKDYSSYFWSKALSISFIRQINLVYDSFKIFENYFDENKHIANVLCPNNYRIAKEYDQIENFISETPIGREQIFSIYMNLFHKKNINKTIKLKIKSNEKFNLKNFIILGLIKIKRFLLSPNKNLIKVGFLGAYFSKSNKRSLIALNNGKVNEMFITIPNAKKRINYDPCIRNVIFRKDKNFDKFDDFFFETQKYFFPLFFLESYISNENFLINNLKKYKNLQTIICENWISNSTSSLTLALSKEKFNINHLNNEHNFISHVFYGRYIEYLIALSDTFYNIGWNSKGYREQKSASLFKFSIKKNNKTKIEILFLAGPIRYKRIYLSSIDVSSQENALNTVKFNSSFFMGLNNNILKKIYYKKYPVRYFIDKEKLYLDQFKNIKKINQTTFNGLDLMAKSKLVIIDYISASYLECLISNIPMIVFLDQDSYKLKEKHKFFFKPLIDSGIFQINPFQASDLLNSIHSFPKTWWESEKVQRGRKIFLDENIGDPEIFINQITDLACNK